MKSLTTLLSALALLAPPSPASEDGKRPNFLFIIADDQSPFDLKAYNSRSTLETPNIDRLATEGMVIDGAHHMGAWAGGSAPPRGT